MPTPGKRWRHVIFGTHGSWLPGDPRGWRSRNHKRHSSGDYKAPPPHGEHEGLHHYSRRLCPAAITLPIDLRPGIGVCLRQHIEALAHRLLILSVGGQHVHMLVELPADTSTVRQIVGHAKRRASQSVRDRLPGAVWASGGKFLLVRTASHQREAYDYIRKHLREGAWVWTFREGVVETL